MRCTISQIYFSKELYIFRTYILSIIKSLNIVYTAIGMSHTSYVDSLLASSMLNSLGVGRGRASPARQRPTTLLPPRSNSKPEAATAVIELLMMGMIMPETC
jgi:hypothetical protein